MAHIAVDIKQFILDNFLYGGNLNDIADDASFMVDGIIDSLGVLELISFVEGTYDIEVADEDVVPANFDSVRGLAAYIDAKIGLVRMVAA